MHSPPLRPKSQPPLVVAAYEEGDPRHFESCVASSSIYKQNLNFVGCDIRKPIMNPKSDCKPLDTLLLERGLAESQ